MTSSRDWHLTRRTMLGAGALGLLAAATRPVVADAAFTVPEVDSLSLQVVTDAATFGPFLDNLDLPGMKVLRAGGGAPGMTRMPAHALRRVRAVDPRHIAPRRADAAGDGRFRLFA